MGVRLDPFQERAVVSDTSSVVTAGAGSGKTTVLAERFVNLIEEGRAEVDSILTLTFTRKAAAEMYERIYRRIGERSGELEGGGEGDSAERVERLRRALADFSSARISTIDSFCSQAVRGGCGRFGIPGDFVQDEHAVSELIEKTALSFLLEYMESPALRGYIRDHGFSAVLENLFVPLAAEEFHLAAPIGFEELYKAQREHLERRVCAELDALEMNRRGFLSLKGSGKWFSRMSALLEGVSDLSCSNLKGDSEPPGGESFWNSLAEELGALSFDKKGATSKKEEILQAKEIIDEMIERRAVALAALDLLTREGYEEMYRILAEYEERIIESRRSAGVLTFRDVVEMTVVLLSEDRDLRRYYKDAFRHIMIDEFQDNNILQKRLLYLLAERRDVHTEGGEPEPEQLEPGKLFFVGDEKQSIYRFRGADVSVFTGLQSEIERTGGEPLNLQYNYRSHPELIRFFNRFFSGFLADPRNREDYEAAYSTLTPFREGGNVTPRIRLFYKPHNNDKAEDVLDSADAEAWHAALEIRRMVEEEQLTVWDRGEERPCRWDDIALLMRSTGNQLRYERFFRRLRIPYTVQSTRSLFMEAPVNDIYLILQLLVYPEDRAAYAGLLRSPFVHLSDESAFSLLHSCKEDLPYAPPFTHTGEEDVFASEEDRSKYRAARELFFALEEMKHSSPPSELIRYLWYEGGYRYILLRRPDYHVYLEFYETLAELARLTESRGESLAVFLDYLRKSLGENRKIDEIELPPAGERGVNIMTVHKSKGLEFPIVMVVDLGNTGAPAGGGPLFVRDWELGPALKWKPGRGASSTAAGRAILSMSGNNTPKGYFSARFEEMDTGRRRAELKRLLYVACTRAQDHLILSGIHHSGNRNIEGQGAEALLNIALLSLGWDGNKDEVDLSSLNIDAEEIPDISREDVERLSTGAGGKSLERMDSLYDSAEELRFPLTRKIYSTVELGEMFRHAQEGLQGRQLPKLEIDPLLRSEAEVTAFGTLCHHRIEAKLKGEDPGTLPGELVGRPEEELNKIVETAELLAESFIATGLGRQTMEGSFESELGFTLRVDIEGGEAVYIKGQIDLIVVGKDEVKVVDFKTDRHAQPEEHAGQLAVYRAAARELYGLPARSYLVYLRGMEVEEVDGEVDITALCSRIN